MPTNIKDKLLYFRDNGYLSLNHIIQGSPVEIEGDLDIFIGKDGYSDISASLYLK